MGERRRYRLERIGVDKGSPVWTISAARSIAELVDLRLFELELSLYRQDPAAVR